jgi:putative endopeptidase
VQALRGDVGTDPHTPDACRVNQAVRNMDGWYDAFGATPESALFLPKERRTGIW